jgi:exodeoxyribonuclease V alpha subunit
LARGLEYRFRGYWDDHPAYGRQFKYEAYTQEKPHSADAIIAYILRYAPPRSGIGPRGARTLVDTFGERTLATIRTDPGAVVAVCPRVDPEQAERMAAAFTEIEEMEHAKVAVLSLLEGRGFPRATVDAILKKWSIAAPNVIKKQPFILLSERIPGCGFLRVDGLYLDLGHDRTAMIRQMFCAWHVVQTDMSGDTWVAARVVADRLREAVSGASVNPRAAVEKGEAEGWLATYKDGEGVLWIADAKRARNEGLVVEFVA